MNPGRSEVLGTHAANPADSSNGIGGTSIPTGWCTSPKCGKVFPLAEVNKSCSCGGSITIKEWRCSALEDRLTAQFEDEVRRRARMAYLDVERTDPDESARMRQQYMGDYSAGAYNWDDEGANLVNHIRRARIKTWGAMYLVFLTLYRCDQNMTQQLAKEIWIANTKDAMAAFLWSLGIVAPPPLPEKEPSKNVQAPTAQEGLVGEAADIRTVNQERTGSELPPLPATRMTFG